MTPTTSQPFDQDDSIDFAELFRRLKRGLPLTLGLACLGLAVAAAAFAAAGSFLTVSTSARVVFSFNGFERGEYPDKSKFSPDDLRSPDIIAEALKRIGRMRELAADLGQCDGRLPLKELCAEALELAGEAASNPALDRKRAELEAELAVVEGLIRRRFLGPPDPEL